MRWSRRTLPGVGAAIVLTVALAGPIRAQEQDQAVVVLRVGGVSLPGLLGTPDIASLVRAGGGGVALLVSTTPGQPLRDLTEAFDGPGRIPADVEMAASSIGDVAETLGRILASSTAPSILVLVVTTPPDGDPRQLSALALARGSSSELLEALERSAGGPVEQTLTSDSTRRDGVVTSADVATSVIDASSITEVGEAPSGSPVRVVDASPPVDLYRRYLEQRRLTVPIGIITGLYVVAVGLFALGILFAGSVPFRLRSIAASVAISVVPLAVALMLVGHLDRLTYATVLTFLAVVTIAGVVALIPVRRASGPLTALAVLGAAVLLVFVIEAALGWTATLTPLLGGAQLDGGRYFGLPNVQIGLLMGSSLYVAQRLANVAAGVMVIVGAALFAGLPWTGSNIGAAITLAAAAGLWWSFRRDGGRVVPTILRMVGVVALVTATVVVAHRYLTDAPTHISRFAGDTGGLPGLWEKFVDRLGVGMDLIVRNPFGLVPVVGVLATLWVVLRPPAEMRASLVEHPVWRDALVTILVGSVIAYVVNDSGAAAIGMGFATSLVGLVYVSLMEPPAKMEGP